VPDLSNSKFHTHGVTLETQGVSDLIYTCPPRFSAITRYLHLSNGTAEEQKVSLQFHHEDDGSKHYLANELVMLPNSVRNLVIGGAYFNLHPKDELLGWSNNSGAVELLISLEEYYDPNRKA